MREVQVLPKLHTLRIDQVTIQSEPRFLIGAEGVGLKWWMFDG